MWSVPLEYETEEAFIKGEERSQEYIEYLVEAAKWLEAGGADFIVIPCNSVHIFLSEVRAAVEIPVLSIVDETVKVLTGNQVRRVGLLATQASLQAGLYQKALVEAGIEVVLPNDRDQAELGELINRLVSDEYAAEEREALRAMIGRLAEAEVEVVLLACTDLQLLAPVVEGVEILDTMEVLVGATVRVGL